MWSGKSHFIAILLWRKWLSRYWILIKDLVSRQPSWTPFWISQFAQWWQHYARLQHNRYTLYINNRQWNKLETTIPVRPKINIWLPDQCRRVYFVVVWTMNVVNVTCIKSDDIDMSIFWIWYCGIFIVPNQRRWHSGRLGSRRCPVRLRFVGRRLPYHHGDCKLHNRELHGQRDRLSAARTGACLRRTVSYHLDTRLPSKWSLSHAGVMA